jgi:hypothetical protein
MDVDSYSLEPALKRRRTVSSSSFELLAAMASTSAQLMAAYRDALVQPLKRWREETDLSIRRCIVANSIVPVVRIASRRSREILHQ